MTAAQAVTQSAVPSSIGFVRAIDFALAAVVGVMAAAVAGPVPGADASHVEQNGGRDA